MVRESQSVAHGLELIRSDPRRIGKWSNGPSGLGTVEMSEKSLGGSDDS